MFWMPDQVRHDESGTFYESIKKEYLLDVRPFLPLFSFPFRENEACRTGGKGNNRGGAGTLFRPGLFYCLFGTGILES